MAPRGLAILMGAGPVTGAGIARVLSSPSQGNYAVALLSRSSDSLDKVANELRSTTKDGKDRIIETFPGTDASSPQSIEKTFQSIRNHPSFKGLKCELAIYSVKHSSRKPFLEETYEDFTGSITTYVGGAFTFAQESIKLFQDNNSKGQLSDLSTDNSEKKGTLIFTGTLGALRCSANYGAYGAGRSSVRQLAQSLAREYSARGIHVVHTIANGGIVDADTQGTDDNAKGVKEGKKMSAESVGKTYLWLAVVIRNI